MWQHESKLSQAETSLLFYKLKHISIYPQDVQEIWNLQQELQSTASRLPSAHRSINVSEASELKEKR